MSPEEKFILAKEKKQIRAFLQNIREANERIETQLVSMISLLSNIRKNYLEIKILVDQFEEKLRK